MLMKKNFLTIGVFILFILIPCTMSAKTYDATQLPIVVRNVPEWSKDYLTVINNWEGMFVNSVNGELPPVLSVVTSVNGNDARGMSEDSFNNLLKSQGKSSIVYLVKKNGIDEKRQCTLFYEKSIYWAEGITMHDPEPFPENITLKNIKNASVFSFNTFAFKTGNIDEIDEASVLEAAGKTLVKLGFKKIGDTQKSDMILSLLKGRDSFNGHSVTLNIMEGKRFREGTERILWSLQISDLSGDLKRQESIIKTALNKQCNNFPFDMPIYGQSISMLGIAFESEEAVPTGKTLKILEGSDAYEKGLRSGDAIVGAYAGYSSDHPLYTRTRRYYFKPNKKDHKKNWGIDLFLILPIIPQFTYNNAYHYLSDDTWRGGSSSKNHFKVRNTRGEKFTVYAPFEKKKFNLKYIR